MPVQHREPSPFVSTRVEKRIAEGRSRRVPFLQTTGETREGNARARSVQPLHLPLKLNLRPPIEGPLETLVHLHVGRDGDQLETLSVGVDDMDDRVDATDFERRD